MIFDSPLQTAFLLRRYKRFLADIKLASGEEITIHCPNTGSMKNCIVEGGQCWYSTSDNPKRKYPHTWEIATTPGGHLAGINTGRANGLVREAIEAGVISELSGYSSIRAEVKYGQENSRIDFLLSSESRDDCYVEVKSVTLCTDSDELSRGEGLFPDAVSQRGSKHLRELIEMKKQGHRAVLVFCVQHTGILQVSPADEIDAVYGETLRMAVKQGVEMLAYKSSVSPSEIVLTSKVPVIL